MATFLKRQTIWTFHHNRNILTTMTSLHYDDYDEWSNKSNRNNRNNNHHRRFNNNNTFCRYTASSTTVRYASSDNINCNKEQQKIMYTSQKGDTAGHMVGSSIERRIRKNDKHVIIKTYSSFKNQWLEETGQAWPSKCSTKRCCNEPTVGAHIFINKKEYAYLVPMCQKCNLDGKNYIHNEEIDNHLRFPIQLDVGTLCVELTHLHISEQSQYANGNIASPTWLEILERFIEYTKKHNSPLVPVKFKNDPQLGKWVDNQRQRYRRDELDLRQIELLESNGFVWNALEYEWDEKLILLKKYKCRTGDCNVPWNYKEDGANLGRWLIDQRHYKKRGILDTVKERQLEELGIEWALLEYEWDKNIQLLMEYKGREGHCNVPQNHKEDGANLGLWIKRQRHNKKRGTLDIVKEQQLEELGIVWGVYEHEWDEIIKLLIEYKDREGHCNVPRNHKEGSKNLGKWLVDQRYYRKRGELDVVKEKQLEDLGIVWALLEYFWDESIRLLMEYKEREGHCNVPRNHKENGKNLGIWLGTQRQEKKKGTLDAEKEKQLEEIGIVWDLLEYEWDKWIKLLMEYKGREGHCNVPARHKEDGANLGTWLSTQRQEKNRGILDTVKEKQLEELGILWDALEYKWDANFQLLTEYKNREGRCNVPRGHKEDGKNLGKWLYDQKNKKLSGVRQERLTEIGAILDNPRTGTE